jgi:hypothetical protein
MKKLRQKYKTEKEKTRKSGAQWKTKEMEVFVPNGSNFGKSTQHHTSVYIGTMKESKNSGEDTTFPNNLEDSCNFFC